ncbi:MAG: hypothetical protein K0S08_151 [Gammaproteobacteria bacterium]|jgi:hypothetical protein|nr:hypothetical protein [Gammaproteobacteria bacterium]
MPSHEEILELIKKHNYGKLAELKVAGMHKEELKELNNAIVDYNAELDAELAQVAQEDAANWRVSPADKAKNTADDIRLAKRAMELLEKKDEAATWAGMFQAAEQVAKGVMKLEDFQGRWRLGVAAIEATPALRDRVRVAQTSPLSTKPSPGATRTPTQKELDLLIQRNPSLQQTLMQNPAYALIAQLPQSRAVEEYREHAQQKNEARQQIEGCAEKVHDIIEGVDTMAEVMDHGVGAAMHHSPLGAALSPMLSGIAGWANALEGR